MAKRPFGGRLACCRHGFWREIDADNLSGRTDQLGREECDGIRAATDVEHSHARCNASGLEKVARYRVDQPLRMGQTFNLQLRMPEHVGRIFHCSGSSAQAYKACQ